MFYTYVPCKCLGGCVEERKTKKSNKCNYFKIDLVYWCCNYIICMKYSCILRNRFSCCLDGGYCCCCCCGCSYYSYYTYILHYYIVNRTTPHLLLSSLSSTIIIYNLGTTFLLLLQSTTNFIVRSACDSVHRFFILGYSFYCVGYITVVDCYWIQRWKKVLYP